MDVLTNGICLWSGYLPMDKPQHNEVVEALDPFKTAPISFQTHTKCFTNLHMLWMCQWMCSYHVIAALIGQAFAWDLPRGKLQHSVVVKAIDPFIIFLTPMPSISKMCHNFHMQWMCLWMFWLPCYHLSHQPSFYTYQKYCLDTARATNLGTIQWLRL